MPSLLFPIKQNPVLPMYKVFQLLLGYSKDTAGMLVNSLRQWHFCLFEYLWFLFLKKRWNFCVYLIDKSDSCFVMCYIQKRSCRCVFSELFAAMVAPALAGLQLALPWNHRLQTICICQNTNSYFMLWQILSFNYWRNKNVLVSSGGCLSPLTIILCV